METFDADQIIQDLRQRARRVNNLRETCLQHGFPFGTMKRIAYGEPGRNNFTLKTVESVHNFLSSVGV